MALTGPQITHVWQEWLASEMRSYYFADLSVMYQFRQKLATWATLLLSSGAAVTMLAKLTFLPWLAPALAITAAAISFYSTVAQNPKNTLDCATLHGRWNRLSTDYRNLWMKWYEDNAQEQLARVDEQASAASDASVPFGYRRRRLLKWENLVLAQHAGHAGHAGQAA